MRYVTAYLALIVLSGANAGEIQEYPDIWSLERSPGICAIRMTQLVGERGEAYVMHASFTMIANTDEVEIRDSPLVEYVFLRSLELGEGELVLTIDFSSVDPWTLAVGGAHALRFHRPLSNADGQWPKFVFSTADSNMIRRRIVTGEKIEFSIVKPNKETVHFLFQDPSPEAFKKRFESLFECFEEMSPDNAPY